MNKPLTLTEIRQKLAYVTERGNEAREHDKKGESAPDFEDRCYHKLQAKEIRAEIRQVARECCRSLEEKLK